MRSKKGFTLIEMLAVIAIIAILVAVTIPVVSGSSIKAAAATNAANLRSVEGEVITMMLLQPEVFDKNNAEQVAQVGTMLDYMVANRDDAFAQYDQTEQNVADMQVAVQQAAERLAQTEAALGDAETQAQLAASAVDAAETVLSGAQIAVSVAQAAVDALSSYLPSWMKQAAIDGLNEAKEELTNAQEDLADAETQEQIKNAIVDAANAAVDAARAANDAAQEDLKAAQDALAAYEDDFKNNYDNTIKDLEDQYYELMYIYTAVDGELDLNGVTLKAPGSKGMKHENLTIDDDVQMVVFVDIENKEAYAMYAGYEVKDFAAIAGETAAE